MKRPRRRAKAGLPRAKPLKQKPNPKHWDTLIEIDRVIQTLRAGMSLKDKKRTSWYRSSSSSK